jgi:hypothetical protein
VRSKSDSTFRNGHQVFQDIPADAERIVFWEVDIAWGNIIIKHAYIKASPSDWVWGWAVVDFDPETDRPQLTGWTGTYNHRPIPWSGTFRDEYEALVACRDRLEQQITRDQERIRDARSYLLKTQRWMAKINARLAPSTTPSQS